MTPAARAATSAGGRRRRSAAVLAVWAACAALAFVALLALGTWQVERRAWKLDLIARVGQRVQAPPEPAPGPGARVSAAADEYRHVRVTGRFLHDRETLVQAVTARGSGFWVLTPLQAADGSVVLVNRGFVPPEAREPVARGAAAPQGPVSVTGLLRLTEPGGAFLRHNDPAADRWYSRDVAAIARARGLDAVAPYFVDADAGPPGLPDLPVGGMTVIAFPNNHLVYALTWYTLALMLAAAAWYLGREEWRLGRRTRENAGCMDEESDDAPPR